MREIFPVGADRQGLAGTRDCSYRGRDQRHHAAIAFFATNRFGIVTVAITDDNFNLDVPNDTLGLPGGDLTTVSVGPTFTVQRWRENFYKLEGEQAGGGPSRASQDA